MIEGLEDELYEDQQWCPPRGRRVPVLECHTNCADECQRAVCWAGRISPSFEDSEEYAGTFAAKMAEVEESLAAFTQAVVTEFVPAFSQFTYQIQRSTVEWLSTEPAWKHLRLRLALRRARRWELEPLENLP